MTRIALEDLHPNPFRDLKKLPTKPVKVELLKKSIKDTSFWDNIVCRKAPNGSGGYQIAYGHNRLEALRQLKTTHVDIPVRDLTNDLMAQIMARENHEEWGALIEVDKETVRSIVHAFGEGHIALPPIAASARNNIRIAPSFVPEKWDPDRIGKAYSVETLAKFIGWSIGKTEDILAVLTFEQGDTLGSSVSLDGLTSFQAVQVIREVRRTKRETDNDKVAKEVGVTLSKELRDASGKKGANRKGKATGITAKSRADEIMRHNRVKRHVEKRTAKEAKISLEKEDRQVAIFLDSAKAWQKAVTVALASISKFSPEAKRFAIGRLTNISKDEQLLKGRLGGT